MGCSQNQDHLSEGMSVGVEDYNKYACVNTKRNPPAVSQLIFAVCLLLSKISLHDITSH